MKRLSTLVFCVVAAAFTAAVWLISGSIPALETHRLLVTAGLGAILISFVLVKAKGIPAPIKAVAVAVMAIVGYMLHASMGLSMVAFLLPLGKWWALAIHFIGGWVQVALVLMLHRAGLIIAWRRKAEARMQHPFWQFVLTWGTFPATVFISVVISPILSALVVLISGVSRKLAWWYVTIAVAMTSVTWIFFGDRIGLAGLLNQAGAAILRLFH